MRERWRKGVCERERGDLRGERKGKAGEGDQVGLSNVVLQSVQPLCTIHAHNTHTHTYARTHARTHTHT